jgi:hypothetical protein
VSPPLVVMRGRSPIVLVAPHGGRRDAQRRPWGSVPLKMNDLHTASLARELAAALDASALVNESGDRNDVDLNRISATHDAAPHFLTALCELIEAAVNRHERVCVVTVHGWNVVQPAVDVGLGVSPGASHLVTDGAAVSEPFARAVLPRLAARLAAAGIVTTPGLRYPARARENLLQLFTGRHDADARPLVRRLAALAPRVDALQLELSLPLRVPGVWRTAFVDACRHALDPRERDATAAWPAWTAPPADGPARVALEFVAPGLSGLAALDGHGGRLILFPDDGRLFTFTGERIGAHADGCVAGLALTATPEGDVHLAYEGPMLAFPDTTPFLDLEQGLAGATVAHARVLLRMTPSHRETGAPCGAGPVVGHAVFGTTRYDVRGHGVRTRRAVDLGGGVRASLRLADGTVVIARGADGVVCRDGGHAAIARCTARDDGTATRLAFETIDGRSFELTVPVAHRLPVVPGVPGAPRLSFVACRDGGGLAGWIQLRSA